MGSACSIHIVSTLAGRQIRVPSLLFLWFNRLSHIPLICHWLLVKTRRGDSSLISGYVLAVHADLRVIVYLTVVFLYAFILGQIPRK